MEKRTHAYLDIVLYRKLLLLLLLSAFPFSQGWPQRIIILHIFLSSTSVSFTPTSCISSFTASKNLLFGLPLLLFLGNSISIIFLLTYSWSLLMTCPYHLNLPFLIFIPNCSTLTVLLMCSFLILSFLVTPIANLNCLGWESNSGLLPFLRFKFILFWLGIKLKTTGFLRVRIYSFAVLVGSRTQDYCCS